MPAGRPSKFSEELANRILHEVSEGKTILTISKEDWSPTRSTIYKWESERPEFSDNLAKAHRSQADHLVDELQQVSRDEDIDVARARLIVESNKWIATRRKRDAYGDKITNELTGKDGGPIQIDKSTMAKRLLFALNEMKRRPQKEDPDAA